MRLAIVTPNVSIASPSTRCVESTTTTGRARALSRSSVHNTSRASHTLCRTLGANDDRLAPTTTPAAMVTRGRLQITSAMSDATASGDEPSGEDSSRSRQTRLQRVVEGLRSNWARRAKRNLRKLPLALISLLVGFSVCALLPHPESPQDAFISFTIILLAEFVSSVLYSSENQGGILRWLKDGDWFPIVINCFKIGVLYGLFVDAFKVGS
jgi:hypothetical protein